MSEKLKPNFTPVPNIIFDEVMRALAPGATKILFAICRFTYGWGKQSDRISLSQLQDITGMARGSVARSIRELGDVVTITPGNPRRQQASEYRLNIEISDKDLVSLRDQPLVSKRDQASLLASLIKRPSKDNQRKKKDTGANAPSHLPLSTVDNSPKKKSKPARRPDPAQLEAFERWYAAYPRHVGRLAAERVWLKLRPDLDLIAMIMAGTENQKRWRADYADDPKIFIPEWKHPETWLRKGCWADETAKPEPVAKRSFVNVHA